MRCINTEFYIHVAMYFLLKLDAFLGFISIELYRVRKTGFA